MTGSRATDPSVLVVGGGITGLSAAFFLARQGVQVTLVERHPSTAIMPQARAFNARSLEIFRAFGLEEEIHEHRSILADMPEMIGGDTLAGDERFRIDMFAQVRPGKISPSDWAMIDQDELERVVRARAETAGADVRFATELVSFEDDGKAVTAVLRDLGSDTESTVHADYLIAADGNRAAIRRRLGVEADGPGVLGHAAHFLFDADLGSALRDRRFLLAYFDQPKTGTVLVPLGRLGRWMLGVPFQADQGESIDDFTEQRCVELARTAVGIPDLELALVPPVPGWNRMLMDVRIGAHVAREYRAGRIFFAGDCAHVVPPTGSFGANTGIADAHNLAWKLAAVLHGHAGAELLDSYEAERHPVAQTTMDTALHILDARHYAEGDEATRIDEVTMAYGYRYRSAAIRTEPGTPDTSVEDPRTPSGRPGLRAPHVWLERAGSAASTLDLFTGSFTVLAGPESTEWTAAAETVAVELGIDVAAHRIGDDVQDPEKQFLKAYGIGASGISLVRPDGFVAWRAQEQADQPVQELREALRGILALPRA
ncbi:FAD-dependent oxidoreductase [Amycolatopsis jiangsuensis]|uniref:Putative polyketide hydroxylase n=1 Tax=Amycolatopsis jiangsuensis TaxID=1181879 RepID=A0A840IYK1_9PSEU|nr:FAD-dependent oxidoreductase [Amycolatopsis jiangsuensis]MBB4686773.1 putative polyketide hydroxylase [Amycolatopsis jiangsuensis]